MTDVCKHCGSDIDKILYKIGLVRLKNIPDTTIVLNHIAHILLESKLTNKWLYCNGFFIKVDSEDNHLIDNISIRDKLEAFTKEGG